MAVMAALALLDLAGAAYLHTLWGARHARSGDTERWPAASRSHADEPGPAAPSAR